MMDLLWAALVILLALLLYTALQLIRFAARQAVHVTAPTPARGARTRPIRWISFRELPAVLASAEDPVVVDLRPDGLRTPIPLAAARSAPPVHTVQPAELAEALAWLPPSRSAIICGVSGLCFAMIRTSPCMRGTAPVYLLTDSRPHQEAA